jgi:Fe-S-cluster-containing hydrogenase component 2
MIFEMASCGGCRTCEIACSFKHTGEFAPSVSSIKILDKEDGLGYRVCLIPVSNVMSRACDGCKELDEPLCIQYCVKGEDLRKILDTFMEKTKSEEIEKAEP